MIRLKAILPPPLDRIASTAFFGLNLTQLLGIGLVSLPVGHLLLARGGHPILQEAVAIVLSAATGLLLFARPDQRSIPTWIMLILNHLRQPRTLHTRPGEVLE